MAIDSGNSAKPDPAAKLLNLGKVSNSEKGGNESPTSSTINANGPTNPVTEDARDQTGDTISLSQSIVIIIVLSGVNFLNTMGSGILTVALPQISKDLNLQESLFLWPASVYALAAGCTLLIFGSLADVLGLRAIWITGNGLYTLFTLGCGFSRTGLQLIIFRTLLGVFIAMCLPSAMSLTTKAFASGTRCNICFACMGIGQRLGYSLRLILGGIFADTIGWRYGYYISAILNVLLLIFAFFRLPQSGRQTSQHDAAAIVQKIAHDIDWIGAGLLIVSMGLLSYVLAIISSNYLNIKSAHVIALLCISVLLLPVFGLWAERQERLQRPVLIPNSLWRKSSFTATCVMIFFTWAVFNAFQYLSTLWFQRVLAVTSLQTSIRFLPMVVVGAVTNIFTGYLVDKVTVGLLVFISAVISSAAPLLMALGPANWSYWRAAFPAMLLSPVNADVLFTVSNLIISRAFPGERQSLAGGVFNAVSQLGNSVGLAVVAAVAASVTAHGRDLSTSDELERGYKSAFWILFASMILVCIVSVWGLRREGKVGNKSD